LARIQGFVGDYEGAEQNARNALLIEPESPKAHAVLAWALDFQGRIVDAEQEIERALELDPNSALSRAYYAEILIDGGEYEAALAAAQKAIEIDPNLLESHRALGYVWELTSNYEDAVQEYETAIRIHPNLWVLYVSLGNMHLALLDGPRAIETYLQASQLAPTNPDPLVWIAQAYARDGEYGKASQYAENAVQLNPTDPYLHGNLGRMYYKNNQFEDAIRELGLAIRGSAPEEQPRVQGLALKPEDPKIVEYYYTYGLALAKGGACQEAIPIFEMILLGVPADETAVANSTEGLVLCGQIEPTATPRP